MRVIFGAIVFYALFCFLVPSASAIANTYRIVEVTPHITYDGDGRVSDFAACVNPIPIRAVLAQGGGEHGNSNVTCYGTVDNLEFKVSISVSYDSMPIADPPMAPGKLFSSGVKVELWQGGDNDLPFVGKSNSVILPLDYKGKVTHPFYLELPASPRLPDYHSFEIYLSYLDN